MKSKRKLGIKIISQKNKCQWKNKEMFNLLVIRDMQMRCLFMPFSWQKWRSLTIPHIKKTLEQTNLYALLVRVQIGTVTLKTSFGKSQSSTYTWACFWAQISPIAVFVAGVQKCNWLLPVFYRWGNQGCNSSVMCPSHQACKCRTVAAAQGLKGSCEFHVWDKVMLSSCYFTLSLRSICCHHWTGSEQMWSAISQPSVIIMLDTVGPLSGSVMGAKVALGQPFPSPCPDPYHGPIFRVGTECLSSQMASGNCFQKLYRFAG